MSNESNQRPVRVTNAKTGAVRTVHVPLQSAEPSVVQQSPMEGGDDPAKTSPVPLDRDMSGQQLATKALVSAAASADMAPQPFVSAGAISEPSINAAGPKQASTAKPKVEIETLEQFIEYAYGRKGQRVSLKAKVETAIAQNPRLDDGAMSRLLALAMADTLLTVPRQLLLVSREVDGYPALRAALGSFVLTVMQRHPAYADAGVQGALRHLPEALSSADALAKVASFTPVADGDKELLKGSELQMLRRNAAHLFATWLASSRGMNAQDLAALLFQVLWAPAARDLPDDNARLRALTEIEQPAGVGLACQRFRQQAIDARSSEDQALRQMSDLRTRLADADAQKSAAESELDALRAELLALREATAAEMAELRQQQEVERTHLRHDQEQLRGRLQRRLDEGVEMLEVGLTALRNKTPRVEVMAERAEHVVDALRAELNNLKEE